MASEESPPPPLRSPPHSPQSLGKHYLDNNENPDLGDILREADLLGKAAKFVEAYEFAFVVYLPILCGPKKVKDGL